MNRVIGVIPARYQSTRLAAKMLRKIGGRPLVQHVYEHARQAKRLDDVFVATDHEEIAALVKGFGGKVVMTRVDHLSGTDRIVEAASSLSCDVVMNIQGDEPFMSAENMDRLAAAFDDDRNLRFATLCVKSNSESDYTSPNSVKVVFDRHGYALYFSRSSLPHYREKNSFFCYKHLGIYAYRRDALLAWSQLPASWLEASEKLEQLRILESGERMKVFIADHDSFGIDTEEDLKRAEEQIRKMKNAI